MKRPPANNLPSVRPARPLRPAAPETIMWPYEEQHPETSGTNHFHWTIVAFTRHDGDTFKDSVIVEVEADSEEGAIARAMTVIQRPYYRVSRVGEACSRDPNIREE